MKTKFYTLLILFATTLNLSAQTSGNALNFDGTDDYVSASLPTVFSNIPNNEFTIEAWIKPEGNAFCRVVFAQLDASNFASLSLSSGNQVYFYISNTVGIYALTSLPTGTWSHVACTWVGSTSEALIYINGTQVATTSGGSSSTGSNNLLTIGAKTNASQFFTGELDEIRIWDIKRTACEILGSFNSDFNTGQTNLVAYYDFNQGTPGGTNTSVTTLPDLTSNYNGTLNSFALSGATSNWVSSGANINATNQNGIIYYGTDVVSACGSYTWIDNNTYTSSNNTATQTFTSVAGCDSTITLNLTILSSSSGTDVISACGSYTWIDNNTYTSSNNSATYNIVGGAANGCDSLVTLNLTINSVSDITTSLSGATITANNSNATYVWLDCDNNNSPVSGETNQSFSPSVNGNFAVELTENGCVDTSACVAVTTVDILENYLGVIKAYPNPTNGELTVSFENVLDQFELKLLSVDGKLIQSKTVYQTNIFELSITEAPGIYFLEITDSNNKKAVIRIVKK